MPEYSYKCPACQHVTVEYHAAGTHPLVVCGQCGEAAHRLYTVPRINWNGLAPSQGELAPAIRRHLAEKDRRRDEFEAIHEAHERKETQ